MWVGNELEACLPLALPKPIPEASTFYCDGTRKECIEANLALKSKYLLVDETGLDRTKVDETAVEEIAVDEPGPYHEGRCATQLRL